MEACSMNSLCGFPMELELKPCPKLNRVSQWWNGTNGTFFLLPVPMFARIRKAHILHQPKILLVCALEVIFHPQSFSDNLTGCLGVEIICVYIYILCLYVSCCE